MTLEDFILNKPLSLLAGTIAGGLLIGVAAALLLWLNGRIAGVSGIINGLLAWKPGDIGWRLLFLGGLVAGAGLGYGWSGVVPLARTNFPGGWLAVGAIFFGMGWGVSGYCPGPIIASLAAPNGETWIVLPAMLLGAFLHRIAVMAPHDTARTRAGTSEENSSA